MSSLSLAEQAATSLRAGEYEKALAHYGSLLKTGIGEEAKLAYLNSGACLRRLGRLDEAIGILEAGIDKFPELGGLYHNLGNCLRDKGGSFRWRALQNYREAGRRGLKSEDCLLSEALVWVDLGHPVQAYSLLTRWQHSLGGRVVGAKIELVQLLLELVTRLFSGDEADPVVRWCLACLEGTGERNPINLIAQAVCYARLGRIEESIIMYDKCITCLKTDGGLKDSEIRQTVVNATWNLACGLLRAGEMRIGWQLYEYGLRAPAKPPMRWQRTLPKVFSDADVTVWRGESLAGKHLLVIGEQAVGDTIMFLRLLPVLVESGARITLAVQERLEPIYKRNFPLLDVVAIDGHRVEPLAERLQASSFDYQIPCGSVPQHCLQKWLDDRGQAMTLVSDETKRLDFCSRYRDGLPEDKPVIGISWRGGGRSDRIRIKSVPLNDFTALLKKISARFVSLQYGEVTSQVNHWRSEGIDIVQSEEVDALKDMDTWLAQVASCDLVVSVANTTIHGAGCLGVRTMCLLSRNSDWRWVEGMEHSYWYESVDCVVQDKRGSWKAAIESTIGWVVENWREKTQRERDYSMLTFTDRQPEGGNAT